MEHHIPIKKCPNCRSTNLEKLREEMDDMSEGELAEYLAGTWGTIYCLDCGKSIDYD